MKRGVEAAIVASALLLTACVPSGAVPGTVLRDAPPTESPAQAYWGLRARSEDASYIASYETSAGSALVYAMPPDRRLDVDTTFAGEQVTIARFYRTDGTYVCDMTHRPRRCTVTDEPDGTPHAQPGTPSLTRIERAPERTIAALPATCFTLIAVADERSRREICFSPDAVLLLVIGTGEGDGPIDRIEAIRVSTVRPDQLDPYK
jgi:hypothetical protein